MDFLYLNSKNTIQKINVNTNDSWQKLKTNDDALNSIFDAVDRNKDGVVQDKEIDLLGQLFNLAKKMVDNVTQKVLNGNNNNEILGSKEIGKLKEALDNANKPNIIDTTQTTQPEKYQYINIYDLGNKSMAVLREEDYSNFNFSELDPGQYYLNNNDSGYSPESEDNICYYNNFTAYKVQETWNSENSNWSEGLNRKISTIKLAANNPLTQDIINELKEIGEQLGFTVEEVYSEGQWIEDYSIRRADGKVLLQGYNDSDFVYSKAIEELINKRVSGSKTSQGAAAHDKLTKEYANTVPSSDQIKGNSYLEGGNVLNTIQKNGKPGAIIGQESIMYTLEAMRKNNPNVTVEMAKQAIASDLGLSVEDITFIPQYDFHIDMYYRPLNDGEIAVPDYSAGIEMLKNCEISNMSDKEKAELISKLQEFEQKTKSIMNDSEKTLSKSGYKVVKIPCFSIPGGDPINYMNGIGGTDKNNKTFYITNKSNYPELDQKIREFFEQNCGISNVFFVSTTSHLDKKGGIDCLTQET